MNETAKGLVAAGVGASAVFLGMAIISGGPEKCDHVWENGVRRTYTVQAVRTAGLGYKTLFSQEHGVSKKKRGYWGRPGSVWTVQELHCTRCGFHHDGFHD